MDEVYAMFQVNLVAVAHLTHRVLPGMLAATRGKVVNNASISGYAYFPAATTYAASKAGVVALTRVAAARAARHRRLRRCTLVTPGVDTDMLDATEDVYGRHMDTSGWEKVPPGRVGRQGRRRDRARRRRARARRQDRPGQAGLARPGLAARRRVVADVQPALREASRSPGASARRAPAGSAERCCGFANSICATADAPLGEARLAVAQVQRPEPPEALVVAERGRAARRSRSKFARQRRSVSA